MNSPEIPKNMSFENQIKLAAKEGGIAQNKPFVLCVDDEIDNLEILEIHLKKNGMDFQTCLNGQLALDYLEENFEKVDAILLDIMMPGIDGIEVLKRIKADDRLKHIPTIMQTAVSGEKKTIEGIEAGAYYYITKPYSSPVLMSILKAAIREKREAQTYDTDQETSTSIQNLTQSSVYKVKNFVDARRVANFLAKLSQDPSRYIVSLTALLINAVEHGNLEIGFETKNKLLLEGGYEAEIENRLKHPVFRNRAVTIEAYRKEDEGNYTIIIKDEGRGFDWNDYLNFEPARMTDPNGRGIAMANIMNPGCIEYWGNGSVVIFKMPLGE
jgi:DNA-binding response OmpR family regulator